MSVLVHRVKLLNVAYTQRSHLLVLKSTSAHSRLLVQAHLYLQTFTIIIVKDDVKCKFKLTCEYLTSTHTHPHAKHKCTRT